MDKNFLISQICIQTLLDVVRHQATSACKNLRNDSPENQRANRLKVNWQHVELTFCNAVAVARTGKFLKKYERVQDWDKIFEYIWSGLIR